MIDIKKTSERLQDHLTTLTKTIGERSVFLPDNLKKTEEGYSVWVPGLPGCWSQGKSEAEALENVKDAISAYLETVDKITTDKETRYVEIAYA